MLSLDQCCADTSLRKELSLMAVADHEIVSWMLSRIMTEEFLQVKTSHEIGYPADLPRALDGGRGRLMQDRD